MLRYSFNFNGINPNVLLTLVGIVFMRRAQVKPFSKRDKFRSQIEYRSHQILNNIAMEFSPLLVVGAYCVGSSIMITGIFCLIRYHSIIDPLFILVLIVLVVIVIVMALILVIKVIRVREESEEICLAFQNLPAQSKADFRFWKSCRPVSMKVGSFGTVESHEFIITLLQSVVLDTTINLLLNF